MGTNSLKVTGMGLAVGQSALPDREPMIALIRKAYDMGVNFCPEAYGPWRNEELVGDLFFFAASWVYTRGLPG
ncbi:MAG: hypothetical protein IPP49_15765 [Saprospiraceae bacterium]|nr:hypothetical protein [Saprospiraceae bacterium]